MGMYNVERCLRKAEQEYEMAGLARQDGDMKAAQLHLENAKLWDRRANEGGYSTDDEQHTS